jgi:hypothetical protein
MVVMRVVTYAEFKALTQELIGMASPIVLARDGVEVGTGFSIMSFVPDQGFAIRCMLGTKPPTFAADYPEAHFVAEFVVV